MRHAAGGLAAQEVHVWHFDHAAPAGRRREVQRILSPDELLRADSFRFERDRSRFVVCRAILRQIVGRYLGVSPGDLGLGYTARGKPVIAGGQPGAGLSFSLSHSDTLGLLGVAVQREVGVDIERVRPDLAVGRLTRVSLTDEERAELEALPQRQHSLQFLTYWTRKEAYLKARGEGLRPDLTQLDLRQSGTCAGSRRHILPHDPRWPHAGARWCVRDVWVGADHVAAMAAAAHEWQVREFRWRWPGSCDT